MLSRTTRILLVVAAVAAAAYLWIGRQRDDGTDGTPERLASFEIRQVDGVIVQREDDTLSFAREDSLWRMTAPVADSAERDAVVPLLDALARADVARNLGAADDLAPYGLDPPLVRVTLLAGADTTLIASIGKRTVDEAWCYATRAHSNELLLVPTDIARAASLPVGAYRNQRVVDFRLRDVNGYYLVTPHQTAEWTRGQRGWFTVVDGDTVAGDSVAVEAVLRRLRGLRVHRFSPALKTDVLGPTDVVGPGQPMTIILRRTSGITQLRFFPEREGAVVQDSKRTVYLDDHLLDLSGLTINDLRERRLIQFSPPDADRIDVSLPNAGGSIVRRGGVWAYPNPALGRVDPDRASDFVRALRSLKWSQVPPRGAGPDVRGAPFSVTVRSVGGTILDEMRAAPRDDGLWYVTSRSSRGVWMIESEDLNALAARFATLKAP